MIAKSKVKKHEMMETQTMKMDAVTIELLLNTLMFVLEALKQTRIYALGVNRVSIKTTLFIMHSVSIRSS